MPLFSLVQARPCMSHHQPVFLKYFVPLLLLAQLVQVTTCENKRHSADLNKVLMAMKQMVDRPNTTPIAISQDKKKFTFKALL